MAINYTTSISNRRATPQITNPARVQKGLLMEDIELVAVAAADSDGDIYIALEIPSNARISELAVMNTAITSGSDYHIGIFNVLPTPTAKNADAFGSAIDMSSARAQFTELTHESADNLIGNVKKMLWELAGDTTDPGGTFYIGLLANTVGSAAGSIALRVRWVTGN